MITKEEHEFFIQLHLTESCNLKCKHCYQTGVLADEMSYQEIKALINEASGMLDEWSKIYNINFKRGFNITGGEPFLRKDFQDIISETSAKGFDIYILTNGTLISRDSAKMLSYYMVKGIQISMEGPQGTHESIRGSGSFDAALRGAGYLLDEGLTVTFNVTLSKLNDKYIEEMIETALSSGVQRIGFARLVPSGRGAVLLDKMLDKERLKAIYKKILSMKLKGLEIVTGDPIASQLSIESPELPDGFVPMGGCAAGLSGLTILPDGIILPCRRLPLPLGNVREDSLREVWAVSPVLEQIRDQFSYKGKCGSCSRWSICRGCRAIAYAYSKSMNNDDFLAEDPQCFI